MNIRMLRKLAPGWDWGLRREYNQTGYDGCSKTDPKLVVSVYRHGIRWFVRPHGGCCAADAPLEIWLRLNGVAP